MYMQLRSGEGGDRMGNGKIAHRREVVAIHLPDPSGKSGCRPVVAEGASRVTERCHLQPAPRHGGREAGGLGAGGSEALGG